MLKLTPGGHVHDIGLWWQDVELHKHWKSLQSVNLEVSRRQNKNLNNISENVLACHHDYDIYHKKRCVNC
jgi:hypothetical protein